MWRSDHFELETNFAPKKIVFNQILHANNFWKKIFFGEKISGLKTRISKNLWTQKDLVKKSFVKRIGRKTEQMFPGQALLGEMSAEQWSPVQNDSRNQPLKFGQKRASNSWDIAELTLTNLN